ncbi:helix-turn-helix domain-containing protein [Roseibium sediminis]|uniref:helix-turn-helix domain-containing protein n=1 Tax=Roseibium sediminis TaxID=1775174 RepID=UPI00123E0C8E|nr:helix-turn-helix domain-containing protein [Roseibium sediminis]
MDVDGKLGRRIADLRQERGLTLDAVAASSGLSRATLSRIERGETSATAASLGQLAKAFSIPMAAFFGGAEPEGNALLSAPLQPVWRDPETGFLRRSLSPAAAGYRGSLIEGEIPAGQTVAYPDTPIAGLEHHLVLVSGQLEVTIGDEIHILSEGDCLRFSLYSGNSYKALGDHPARYYLCVIQP